MDGAEQAMSDDAKAELRKILDQYIGRTVTSDLIREIAEDLAVASAFYPIKMPDVAVEPGNEPDTINVIVPADPDIIDKREPEFGALYTAVLFDGRTRILRYGYHRKNNLNNWSRPELWGRQPDGNYIAGPSCVWVGWRDHESLRFYRPEQVVSYDRLHIE